MMTYQAICKIIDGGRFDKEKLLSKMDLLLLGDRISEDEYSRLVGLLLAKSKGGSNE